MFEPRNVVLNIDEFSEMEIRPNLGVSCRRLGQAVYACIVCIFVCNPSLQDFTKYSINPALLACVHRMLAVCNPSKILQNA